MKLCQLCGINPRRPGGNKKPFRLCEPCHRGRCFCACGNRKAVEAKKCQSCYLRGMKGPAHPSWKGGRQVTAEGYVKLHVPEHPRCDRHGYVWEHWLVMEHSLGRQLFPDENVHHLNGVRDDNRPVNLELWNQSQPSGQRVSDKVDWAKSILARYEVSAAHNTGPLPVAVDFDGTLATSLWTPDNPTTEIGEPILLNIVKTREISRAGWRIVIYTARGWEDQGKIEAWLTEHQVPFDAVICGKLLAALYVDDRGRHADAANWTP